MIMAVRVVNTCSIVRSTTSPPVAAFQCRFYHFRTLQLRCHSKSGFRFPIFLSEQQFLSHAGFRSCSVHSLVDSVMKELKTMRKRKRVSAKVGFSGGELLVKKLENQVLQKGLLLEFKKDSDRILLAVAQRPDGKKNWMVSDQNGVSCSIKPQQITFIVPGVENFDHSEISQFLQKAQDNLDPALLEFAWVELLEKNKSVTAEELAEMTFGSAEPLESYCAHLLLSKDEIYFSVLATKGSRSIYAPRSTAQVEELLRRKLAKEAAEKELQEFVQQLMSAKAMPAHDKPLKSSWMVEEKVRYKIESLEAYAIDACKDDDQKKTAGMVTCLT
ncbi:hypothetical protein Patl1_31858 [Pistacia atlantica]|uniref:Uncharacterized protein n=1 Tax=Pistacia atlantica TaxID=434234 RepID=A0ACC1ARU2_9ROSI|nr:hypothetical protein Patl1_31858 [Pistacia atlantica]